MQPFTADKMSEIKNRRIFDRKLGKVGKKQYLMEELIKNQQKAYSNLITKSKQLGGIFVTKNELQQRLENVQSVGRFWLRYDILFLNVIWSTHLYIYIMLHISQNLGIAGQAFAIRRFRLWQRWMQNGLECAC